MGRKAVNKERQFDAARMKEWVQLLMPVFSKNGIVNLTMDEVAASIGKSKATLYKYFKTREDILTFALEFKLHEIAGFEAILMDQSQPYLERYYKGVALFLKHTADISNLFLRDLKHHYPDLWQQILIFENHALEVLKTYYEEGIAQGRYTTNHAQWLVLSDKIFFEAMSDPDFLMKEQIQLHLAFEHYFKMKFFGVLKADFDGQPFS